MKRISTRLSCGLTNPLQPTGTAAIIVDDEAENCIIFAGRPPTLDCQLK